MMVLTGGEIVALALAENGVPYAVGIPGHGCLALADAFLKHRKRIGVLKVMQEMSAVHLADGFYRACGMPLAVFTSIGPGAVNTAIGAATSFVDSIPVLIINGSAHTYMRGKGLLQEVERKRDDGLESVLAPVVKRAMRADGVEQLPSMMRRAFNVMLSGRRGPVSISLPMDVQAEACDVEVPLLRKSEAGTVGRCDPLELDRAVRLFASARRPVILAGGGVRQSGAEDLLLQVAEIKGAAVVTTMQGKSCFPEGHRLYAWHTGSKGTAIGLKMTRSADVILAVGCRFADETCCSYRQGAAFSIPPTRLIHVDIDPYEIGKNYHAEVGICADARGVLEGMLQGLKEIAARRNIIDDKFVDEIGRERKKWEKYLERLRSVNTREPTISQVLFEVRKALPPDTIVVTSSGNTQAQVMQEFEFPVTGTLITTGGFSTMGYTLPASIGAKLAAEHRVVAGIVGDGDFLMSVGELAAVAQLEVPVLMIVVNNCGWIAIKDLQMDAFGARRAIGVDFETSDGNPYSPDIAGIARAFGIDSKRISKREEIVEAVRRAVRSGRPFVLEVMVNRGFPLSGSPALGWWDVPVPAYLKARRKKYESERSLERLY